MSEKHPLALVILDGFGHAPKSPLNAVTHAHIPHLRRWTMHYPHTLLAASGSAVGLPEGYDGNSEVGHLTIGAGRIINQNLVRINTLIKKNKLKNNPVIERCFSQLAASNNTLHLMGLLSDAGVHSHIEHLFAYIDCALAYKIHSIMIHPFLDGRDVAPESAYYYLQKLENRIAAYKNCTIASMTGRFYALDRNHNWDRTQAVYSMLTQPKTPEWSSWQEALEAYYKKKIYDEFIPPTPLFSGSLIHNNDGILFFNFRSDRARQLTASFTQKNFTAFKRTPPSLAWFITPVQFDEKDYATKVLLSKIKISNTLKQLLAGAGKTIFSIAETEKYAHITYFFNGEKEEKVTGETRILIPSKVCKNYSDIPEMSAPEITKAVLDSLQTNPCDFYLVNYANADMVGHSGNFQATVQALECLDHQLKKLYDTIVVKMNGTLIITADHGKAEEMFDAKTGQPRTAHTTNPVPFLVLNKKFKNNKETLQLTKLSDIAPFILNIMHITVPKEMQKK